MFENYTNLARLVGKGILVVGMTISGWFGVIPSDYFVPEVKEVETKVVHEYLPAPVLGGTFVTPEVKALFNTTLASRITSSATSMTLSSATDKDGNTLASSTYGFIIDEGTSVEEFVLADCTGTACTNMTRGVSVSTATTSVTALKFEHNRGASVKITTAPSLVFAINVLKGKQNLENIIRYNSHPTFTLDTHLVDKKYVDDTAFSGAGVIDASATARGVSELATAAEAAASTATGGSGVLVLPASLATSTYNSATAANRVVVTGAGGKIDSNFLTGVAITNANNTWTGTNVFSTSTTATTTIGAFPAWEIGKQKRVFTSSGTFTVPTGITKVLVRIVGGGAGGGTASCGGANQSCGSGGGGAGGATEVIVDVTATTSIGVTIGAAGGTATNGGTTYFSSFINCTGGTAGASSAGSDGGAGGTCTITTGDTVFRVDGQYGSDGMSTATSLGIAFGGIGGTPGLGFGVGGSQCGNSTANGRAGQGYGAGGGGGCGSQAGGDGTGGSGTAGAVIIYW